MLAEINPPMIHVAVVMFGRSIRHQSFRALGEGYGIARTLGRKSLRPQPSPKMNGAGQPCAAAVATCPASVVTNVLRLVSSDNSVKSPVANAVRGDVSSAAAP